MDIKEKINQLEKEIIDLKSQLPQTGDTVIVTKSNDGNRIGKTWCFNCRKATQAEIDASKVNSFKEGTWVFVKHAIGGCTGAFNKLGRVTKDNCSFNGLLESEKGVNIIIFEGNTESIWRVYGEIIEATEKQIEEHLLKIARHRGYKEGCKVHSFYHNKPVICNETGRVRDYYKSMDKLQFGSNKGDIAIIYQNGKWAEILNPNPEIIVNDYTAEFKGGYVEFGYTRLDNKLFKDINDLFDNHNTIKLNSNRQITSVTIGKGTFTIGQIKQIVGIINNK